MRTTIRTGIWSRNLLLRSIEEDQKQELEIENNPPSSKDMWFQCGLKHPCRTRVPGTCSSLYCIVRTECGIVRSLGVRRTESCVADQRAV
jgi:hypothetical protein